MQAPSDLPNGRAAVYHDNSSHGEDAYVTRELHHQFVLDAVLDGATGRGGAQASSLAANMLREAKLENLTDLTDLLDLANKQLFQRGRGRFFLTTAAVTLKLGDVLEVVSVGDSSVLLIRDGDVVSLTFTTIGPMLLDVSNGLGRREALSYKITRVMLSPQDRLVLATDGLIENVAPSELAALVSATPSPEEAVSALQQLLCERKRTNRGRVDDHSGFRHDDATAIIRYVGLDPNPQTSGSTHDPRHT
jgi:serine/threonine protein phosphatase PrpC